MMTREEVIKGLECCEKKVCIFKDTEKECPYWKLCGEHEDAFEDCTTALVKDALALLKAQEAVEPVQDIMGDALFWVCGKCGYDIISSDRYCANCGRAVKWDD